MAQKQIAFHFKPTVIFINKIIQKKYDMIFLVFMKVYFYLNNLVTNNPRSVRNISEYTLITVFVLKKSICSFDF